MTNGRLGQTPGLILGALYILFVLLYPQGLMQVNLRRLLKDLHTLGLKRQG